MQSSFSPPGILLDIGWRFSSDGLVQPPAIAAVYLVDLSSQVAGRWMASCVDA
jgi:hypothetical protein